MFINLAGKIDETSENLYKEIETIFKKSIQHKEEPVIIEECNN